MADNQNESQEVKPPSSQNGLRRLLLIIIILAAAAILLFVATHKRQATPTTGPASGPAQSSATGPLYCYVGGTMRPVMEKLAEKWLAKTGQKIELAVSDSGAAIIAARTAKKGDLIIVHDPFHGMIANEGMSVDGWHVATLTPVMVVKKGNPKDIKSVKDVARDDVKLIYTDPEHSTLGHIMPIVFRKAGLDPRKMQDKAVSLPRSGGEAANAVKLGTADAGFCWDAVAFLRKDALDAIAIAPDLRPQPKVDVVSGATFGNIDMSEVRVTIDVLGYSTQNKAAEDFAAFCASKDNESVWTNLGFSLPREGPTQLKAAVVPTAATQPAK